MSISIASAPPSEHICSKTARGCAGCPPDGLASKAAIGTWSGGRFMRFGSSLGDDGLISLLRSAPAAGARTFVTADVYGNGAADRLLGRALAGEPRGSFSVVGMIGHDFYGGERKGMGGYQRFTDPELRGEAGYGDFLMMAAERSLERLGLGRFDLLLLHNPDSIGYSSPAVWKAMARLKSEGFADRLGIAPGPANGFVLDQIRCFERFGEVIDWAMIILNPLEPWPSRLVLPAAEKFGVKVLARVVDHSGIFHDDVRPDHWFQTGDHRTHRPTGWVNDAHAKMEAMRPIAERHGLSMLQFAAYWTLGLPMVEAVVPTYIEEDGGRGAAEKLSEMAMLAERPNPLSWEDIEAASNIGDNTGCMALKGASHQHHGPPIADAWEMAPELLDVAERWGIDTAW